MRLSKILSKASIFGCVAILAGCLWEEGFEYQTKATLDSMNASGIKGTVIFGYGFSDWKTFRMRIAASGLSRNVPYEVRFLDAAGCSESDLAHAKRIDVKRRDPDISQEGWGFNSEQIILIDSIWGSVEKEFRISPPNATHIRAITLNPDRLPTVVIYALSNQKNGTEAVPRLVACGRISDVPRNQVPHT